MTTCSRRSVSKGVSPLTGPCGPCDGALSSTMLVSPLGRRMRAATVAALTHYPIGRLVSAHVARIHRYRCRERQRPGQHHLATRVRCGFSTPPSRGETIGP